MTDRITNTATMRTVRRAPARPRRTWRNSVKRFQTISPPRSTRPSALMMSSTEYSCPKCAEP